MDLTSPRLLKLKAALFLAIVLLSAGLLAATFWPLLSWPVVGLFFVCLWASCRAYYFCFYVLQHYADPQFRYAGLLDALGYLAGLRRKR